MRRLPTAALASLWKVGDTVARHFMIAFHRALPSAGRSAVLQQAQLSMLRNPQTARPYSWAPFMLLGGR